MSQIKLSKNFIKNTVKLALNEDLFPTGDITSNLIKNDKIIKFNLISNQNAIVGGLQFAKEAFNLVDDKNRNGIEFRHIHGESYRIPCILKTIGHIVPITGKQK